ncbi:MAG: hypothetical protein H6810_07500 [Phycisphaeraceae bacterium]|nr:MAG: hypothetical protein H6810_07500 [Phycisphaeraceae bacterium]
MQDIHRVLKAAARRLYLDAFLRFAVVFATVAGAAMFVLVAAHKLGPWEFRWSILFGAAAGVSVLAAAFAAFVRRPRGLSLADEVDRRAGLRETLSTAVVLAGHEDAWSRAVTESAGERARRVVLRDAVPITAPRRWPLPVFLLAAAGLGLWLAPRHDLSGLLASRDKEKAEQVEIRNVALEIKSQDQEIKKTLESAGVDLKQDKPDDDGAEQGKPKTAEELKRSQIKKLTKLSDQLNELKQGEKAQKLEALQRSMRQLKTSGPGPLDEFGRNLARGNFQEAQKALEAMQKAVESGQMTDEQKKQAAQQLAKLAQQMQALADQKDALKNALEQAGMDPQQASQLAADPQALQQALQQTQGLSQQQIQSLMQMAATQQSACQSMQSMSQAMSQMSQCMNPGNAQNGQKLSQCSSQLAQQLSAAEMMQCEMQAVDKALGQCNSNLSELGQSLCKNGGSGQFAYQYSQGQGVGPGIGAGDGGSLRDPDLAPPDDYILKSEKADVPNNGGPIIGSTLVYGAQVKGEATAQFGQVVGASAVEAAEAIDSMQVPREYHDAVRHYFGRLEAIAKKGGDEAKSESSLGN